MGSYYYLMAQLPSLVYEQKPPMSSTAFRDLAHTLMDKSDSALLGQVSLDPDPDGAKSGGSSYKELTPSTGCEFIDNWREWERVLRLNLAKNRAVKLKRESSSTAEPPYYPADAVGIAVKAVAGELSPLDGEIFIDKARWNTIEYFAGRDYFDRNNVYAYLLKLLLLERRLSFNTEKGFSEYKSLYASIIESAHNSLGEPK